MERKLLSIQKIEYVKQITDADKIEMILVLGWECVAEKGKFKPMYLALYFEIDSLIPRESWSEFLFKITDKKDYRLRTTKFSGQISQGLIIPFSLLDEEGYNDSKEIGTDVSLFLNIKKYEPTITAIIGGCTATSFPSVVTKTDEMRVQSFPDVLKEVNGKNVYVSTKLDGMSITVYFFEGHLGVCTRNLELNENKDYLKKDNTLWKIVYEHNLSEKLYSLDEPFAIQGELVGPGISKNPLNLKKSEWFVFNVYNIKKGCYLDEPDFIEFCKEMDLPTVPVEEITVAKDWSVEQLLERTKGLYEGTTHQKEGIVIRPVRESYSETLKGRLSFKVINNDYLLSMGS